MPAVFVLPTVTSAQHGPVAAYVSTVGWAAAADRVLGGSWIVTPTGIIDQTGARRRATGSARAMAAGPIRPRHPYVPTVVKTLVKDIRRYRQARSFSIDPKGPWTGEPIDFVWQRHDLFHTAGLDLARDLGVPSVLFVPATTVWEAERWGTHRPGWGPWIEKVGERPALGRADVVACGSAEVAEQVERLGVDPDRIVITPTGVDLQLFTAAVERRDALREELGLTGRFVVGWVGSFRPFHALERAIAAVERLPDATLLLVGDGPRREAVEELARQHGVPVVCTGTIAHDLLPEHLSAMDVGLVLSPVREGYHYSPLKLAEYLASGLPVVAPAVDPITSRLTDGVNALLVEPTDALAMRVAVERLHADPDLRHRLGAQARVVAEERWSWDQQVRRVLEALPGADGS